MDFTSLFEGGEHNPIAAELEQAMAGFREQQARMESMREELQASSASATSKDRLVTAKVGPQGQVISLTFHTSGYRDMAPAELGKLLTDVLNEARAKMGDQVIKQMKSFPGFGDMFGSLSGGSQLDAVLEPLRAMMPGYEDEEEARKKEAAKQAEFTDGEAAAPKEDKEKPAKQAEFTDGEAVKKIVGKQEEFTG